MRIKNVRKTRPKSPTRGAQYKRQRRQSPQVDSNDPENPQEPISVPVSDTPGAMQPETWSMILARVADQPFTFQVQKFKDWRRAGSTHDDQCCICHKPDNLELCNTCRLAFHPHCLPNGWARDSGNHLFCAICVARGWDHSPPVLTPPTSPRPSQAELPAPVSTTNADSNALKPAPALRNDELEVAQAHYNTTPGAKLAVIAGQVLTNARSDYTASSCMPADSGTAEPRRRQRKSRYSTLSGEVDLSLATIYRELESVASLRSQIEYLRDANAQQTQNIRIHEQNQQAMRKELETLRANATNSASATRELNELREKNASLEAELQISREQTAAAKELKQRLAQLLNN